MPLFSGQAAAEPAPGPVLRISDLPQRFAIAHRGAGSFLAPENTAAALDRGIKDPDSQMLEFDVQTLADGAGGIWHDETVDRISTSTGPVGSYDTAGFKKLTIDAATWFGGGAKNVHPLLLNELLAKYGGRKLLLAHPKDTPATQLIIDQVKQRGLTQQVQLQTFSRSDALLAGQAGLVTQLLIGTAAQAGVDTPAVVKAAGIPRVSLDARLPDATIASYVHAGLIVSCYGVNRITRRDRLYALGVRGIDTDDPTYLRGATARYHRKSDPFRAQTWWPGHLGQAQDANKLSAGYRGSFSTPGWWTVTRGSTPLFARQGWASPAPRSFTMRAWIRFNSLGTDRTRWGGLYFSALRDHPYNDAVKDPANGGYSLILRQDGRMELFRKDPGGTVLLKTVRTAAPKAGTVAKLKIQVTAKGVYIRRYDVATAGATVKDTRYRGTYLYLGRSASAGHQGPGVSFGNITYY